MRGDLRSEKQVHWSETETSTGMRSDLRSEKLGALETSTGMREV